MLDQLQALLRTQQAAPQWVQTYDELSVRRMEHFRDDPRAGGDWNVQFDSAGRIRLHCEAHVPPALMPPRK